jgi:hypothetical protein
LCADWLIRSPLGDLAHRIVRGCETLTKRL